MDIGNKRILLREAHIVGLITASVYWVFVMSVCVWCVFVSLCDIFIVSLFPTISEFGKVHHTLKVWETLLESSFYRGESGCLQGFWYLDSFNEASLAVFATLMFWWRLQLQMKTVLCFVFDLQFQWILPTCFMISEQQSLISSKKKKCPYIRNINDMDLCSNHTVYVRWKNQCPNSYKKRETVGEKSHF